MAALNNGNFDQDFISITVSLQTVSRNLNKNSIELKLDIQRDADVILTG